MDIDVKPQASYEVATSDGQTFAGKPGTLPGFLTHIRLKELLDSDLGSAQIKCAYTANQLRGATREWFVRSLPSRPQLLQQWTVLEGALVATFGEAEAIRRQREECELAHLKQTASVSHLVAQLEGLCDALGWAEAAKRGLFINALKTSIRKEVLKAPHAGYAEVKRIALTVEAALALTDDAPSGKKTRRSKKSGKAKCYRCHRPGHVQKDCYAKNTADAKTINYIQAQSATPSSEHRVRAWVGDTAFDALIDTGAAVNCIRETLAPPERMASNVTLKGATGVPLVQHAQSCIISVDNRAVLCYIVCNIANVRTLFRAIS